MNITVRLHRAEIWELKTVLEWGKPTNNSFCAMGCADAINGTFGQTSWVRGYKPDYDFVLSLQQPDPDWTPEQKWQYAVGLSGTIYLYDKDGVDYPFRWPRIMLGSKGQDIRNRVQIIDHVGDWHRLQGIGPQDYGTSLGALLAAGLVQRVNCEPYQDKTGYFSDTPHGVMYTPVFDPRYYERSKGQDGLWITSDYLYRQVQ